MIPRINIELENFSEGLDKVVLKYIDEYILKNSTYLLQFLCINHDDIRFEGLRRDDELCLSSIARFAEYSHKLGMKIRVGVLLESEYEFFISIYFEKLLLSLYQNNFVTPKRYVLDLLSKKDYGVISYDDAAKFLSQDELLWMLKRIDILTDGN